MFIFKFSHKITLSNNFDPQSNFATFNRFYQDDCESGNENDISRQIFEKNGVKIKKVCF